MSSANWYNGKSINEVEFCTEFMQNRPLKCISGKLFDIDGEVSDSEICHDISVMLTEFVTTGISRKVKSLLEALKLSCHSKPIPIHNNEIHLINGILKTDGTWIPEKRFCVNRLNIFYCYEMQNNNNYPDHFMNFLHELLDLEDVKTLTVSVCVDSVVFVQVKYQLLSTVCTVCKHTIVTRPKTHCQAVHTSTHLNSYFYLSVCKCSVLCVLKTAYLLLWFREICRIKESRGNGWRNDTFDRRYECQKYLCVTFAKVTKAYLAASKIIVKSKEKLYAEVIKHNNR